MDIENRGSILAVNLSRQGDLDPGDVVVFLKENIFVEIEQYSRADLRNERGGMLLGDFKETEDGLRVSVTAYIPAKHTKSTVSSLTFTHETWADVHERQQREHPDKKIVGWHHTHPGYGIFLSAHDLFIHENFFDLPWQVAYVVDPVEGTDGFFQWKDGHIQELKGYYIY